MGDQATHRPFLGFRLGFVIQLERTRPQRFTQAWNKHQCIVSTVLSGLQGPVACRDTGQQECDPGWLLLLCMSSELIVSSVSSLIPTTTGLVQESPGQMEKTGTQPAG